MSSQRCTTQRRRQQAAAHQTTADFRRRLHRARPDSHCKGRKRRFIAHKYIFLWGEEKIYRTQICFFGGGDIKQCLSHDHVSDKTIWTLLHLFCASKPSAREPMAPVTPCTDDTSRASSMWSLPLSSLTEPYAASPSTTPRTIDACESMYPDAGVIPARPARAPFIIPTDDGRPFWMTLQSIQAAAAVEHAI